MHTWRVFHIFFGYVDCMQYNKPPLSIPNQVILLEQRGLIIQDKIKVEEFLEKNTFYRFRGYTYSYQDNNATGKPFIGTVNFETIVGLYNFDKELRLLLFEAIEKIEISIRSKIINEYAIAEKDSHWHQNHTLFIDRKIHKTSIKKTKRECKRSNEKFITHYYRKYTTPVEPPCWASFEIMTFGHISTIYANLDDQIISKKDIASYFGLAHQDVLKSWLHSINSVRNICAHHGRLWNRSLAPRIKMPKKTKNDFIINKNVYTNKIYAHICCIQYLLNIIEPQNDFKIRFKQLFIKYPHINKKSMGFPIDWETENFWQ